MMTLLAVALIACFYPSRVCETATRTRAESDDRMFSPLLKARNVDAFLHWKRPSQVLFPPVSEKKTAAVVVPLR